MKQIYWLLGVFLLFSPILGSANESAFLESLEGASSLEVRSEKGSRNVKPGMLFFEGERFKLSKEVVAHLVYSDGSQVIVAPGSELSMGQGHGKHFRKHDDFNLSLWNGKIAIWVKKGKVKNRHRFKIRSTGTAMGVRGTYFIVYADKNGSKVHVMNGFVEVSHHSKLLEKGKGVKLGKEQFLHLFDKEKAKAHKVKSFDSSKHLAHFHSLHPELEKLVNRAHEHHGKDHLKKKYKKIKNSKK